MATDLRHEPDAHRYTMFVDGELVSVAEYLDHGRGIVFHHTVTIPKHRGNGYADRLITFAMDDVERRGAGPVSPTCWYVAEWFDRHPERAGLRA
ncbi:MAG TPA: GNAT family N-acetyltransferase [Pseudolysinimonas sp.]|nr:GNAT family N-acetyltransferase [Pseudolysinimonas sp.]